MIPSSRMIQARALAKSLSSRSISDSVNILIIRVSCAVGWLEGMGLSPEIFGLGGFGFCTLLSRYRTQEKNEKSPVLQLEILMEILQTSKGKATRGFGESGSWIRLEVS